MSSVTHEIPLAFMDPRQKYSLMNYLVKLGLPSRISRNVLAQWGEAMGVDITSMDYELLAGHSLVTPAVHIDL